MTNETQAPSLPTPESEPQLNWNQEILQYNDGQLALELTGEEGDSFDWDKHKYSPTRYHGEAIVITKSGNSYYIRSGSENTILVNVGESVRQKKLIAVKNEAYPATLPLIEFKKPWRIPGFYDTSDVEKVLLKYKYIGAHQDYDGARKVDLPGTNTTNPFDQYNAIVQSYGHHR